MTEHLSDRSIDRYCENQLDDAARRQIEAHLSVCSSCVTRVSGDGSGRAFDSLSEAFLPPMNEPPFHLSEAELVSYARDKSDAADRVICESHLESCGECQEKSRSLTTQRFQMRRWLDWSSPTPVRIAAAVALLALIILVALLWRQPSRSGETARGGPAQTASPLPSAENVSTPEQTSIPATIAMLRDNGREIRLDASGKLTGIEDFDNDTQQLIKRTLTGESLVKPKVLTELEPKKITLLGQPQDNQTFQLIGPLGEVIERDRPTLKWKDLNGASSYVVTIYDQNFNPVMKSPSMTATEWLPAESLKRGNTFFWEVVATKDGKEVRAPIAPASKAEFKVLDARQFEGLMKLRAQKPQSHLALGLAYAKSGLVTKARTEFSQLVKDNPNAVEPARLLKTVREWPQ